MLTAPKTFLEKTLDNRHAIVYNNGRSEEERKTPGPTADLPFFKLYARGRTTYRKLYVQKFFQKNQKNFKKPIDI